MKRIHGLSTAFFLLLTLLVLTLAATRSNAKEIKFTYDQSGSCTAEDPCGVVLHYTTDGDITEDFEFRKNIGAEPEGFEFIVDDNFVVGKPYRFALTAYRLRNPDEKSAYSNIVEATIEPGESPQDVTIPAPGNDVVIPPIIQKILSLFGGAAVI